MGNIHAESSFNTKWSGDQGSVGICQWLPPRSDNLEAYANSVSGSKTDIAIQAAFILEEGTSSGTYEDSQAVTCFNFLKDTDTINSVKKQQTILQHYMNDVIIKILGRTLNQLVPTLVG